MEDAGAVHVVERLQQLPHVLAHELLGHVHAAPPDQLVDVLVHQLEHQRQPPRPVVAATGPHRKQTSGPWSLRIYWPLLSPGVSKSAQRAEEERVQEDLQQADHVGVGRHAPEGLHLPETVDLHPTLQV